MQIFGTGKEAKCNICKQFGTVYCALNQQYHFKVCLGCYSSWSFRRIFLQMHKAGERWDHSEDFPSYILSESYDITNLRDLKYWENRIKIKENWWNNQLKFNQTCLTSYAQYRNYLNFYIFLLNSIFFKFSCMTTFFNICNYTHNLFFYSTIFYWKWVLMLTTRHV